MKKKKEKIEEAVLSPMSLLSEAVAIRYSQSCSPVKLAGAAVNY